MNKNFIAALVLTTIVGLGVISWLIQAYFLVALFAFEFGLLLGAWVVSNSYE